MVASWLSGDIINDVILVLIGEQGAYKTTWCNHLLPPLLRQYSYTKTNANRMTKDDLITLAQYALVCCEELDTMRPAELNQLKAVVTMPSIDERAAYAHYHEHRKLIETTADVETIAQIEEQDTAELEANVAENEAVDANEVTCSEKQNDTAVCSSTRFLLSDNVVPIDDDMSAEPDY